MQMFQPQLTLLREPDGEFTLVATTPTPSSCYAAGRAVHEVPPNVRLLPEVFSVLLHLRARTGPCLMFVKPVHHRLRHLKLGTDHGKTSVTAFTLLDGRILGSASIPVPASGGSLPSKNPVPVDTADWYAWVNRMPPGPASFHVTGTVVLPSPGYEVALRVAAPQGINPSQLLLSLEVKAKPGFWPQVITTQTVRFELPSYTGTYQSVLVREPDGDNVHLDIDEIF